MQCLVDAFKLCVCLCASMQWENKLCKKAAGPFWSLVVSCSVMLYRRSPCTAASSRTAEASQQSKDFNYIVSLEILAILRLKGVFTWTSLGLGFHKWYLKRICDMCALNKIIIPQILSSND